MIVGSPFELRLALISHALELARDLHEAVLVSTLRYTDANRVVIESGARELQATIAALLQLPTDDEEGE